MLRTLQRGSPPQSDSETNMASQEGQHNDDGEGRGSEDNGGSASNEGTGNENAEKNPGVKSLNDQRQVAKKAYGKTSPREDSRFHSIC